MAKDDIIAGVTPAQITAAFQKHLDNSLIRELVEGLPRYQPQFSMKDFRLLTDEEVAEDKRYQDHLQQLKFESFLCDPRSIVKGNFS